MNTSYSKYLKKALSSTVSTLSSVAIAASPLMTARLNAAEILPTGGQVESGSATIGVPTPGSMQIDQTSDRAIIGWDGFSIGAGNQVQFNVPNANSATLNRVNGSTTSTIAGQMRSNGQLFLINPNGILITPTGSVRSNAFIGSSLDISNSDFLSGKTRFKGKGSSADVINQGEITTEDGGAVVLMGGHVENSGSIEANEGAVGLASGEDITVDLTGDGLLSVSVPTSSANQTRALVAQTGRIKANGGRVELKAAATAAVPSAAINVSGDIEANSVEQTDSGVSFGGDASAPKPTQRIRKAQKQGAAGTIVVDAGEGKTVIDKATVSAISKSGKGGQIAVTGREVVLSAARLAASGNLGGGKIEVGGSYQGKGPVANADSTEVDAFTVIDASATDDGDGGEVVIWADNRTAFSGSVTATGGKNGGDGGNVEVSGKAQLAYLGTVNTLAPKGKTGNLLLDPYDVTISTGADTNQTNSAGTFTATGSGSVINVNTLQNALASSNVTVSTGASGAETGNIIVANAITWSTNTTLTLTAAGNIWINAGITNSGATSGLTLNASGTTGISGSGFITNNGTLTMNVANASGTGSFGGYVAGTGSLIKTGAGTQNLTGPIWYTGTTNINGGTFGIAAASFGGAMPVINVNNGGTLSFLANDTWGSASTASSSAITINAGGMVKSNGTFNTLWNLTLNGGTLNANGGVNGNYGAFALPGTVTVTGASQILASGSNSQINLSGYGNATTTFNIVNATDSLQIAAALQNRDGFMLANLIKSGAGTLTLTGNNTYTGTTTISAGTLQVGNGGTTGALGTGAIVNNANLTYSFGSTKAVATPSNYSGPGNLSLTGGLVWFPGNLSVGGNLTINSTTSSSAWLTTQTDVNPVITVGGTTSITGYLASSGPGNTLTLNASGAVTLNNITNGIASSFWNWGTVNINAGTNPINVTGTLNMSQGSTPATWNLTGQTNVTGNITGPFVNANLNIAGTANSSISGVLYGNVALQKSGTGMLTLTGANNYTGPTTVNAGTLKAGAAATFSSGSAMTVASGGTLDLGGFSNSIGSLAGAAGAIVTNNGAAATLTAGGDNTSTTFSGIIQNGTGATTLIKAGTGTLTLSGANSYTGSTTISAGTLQVGNGGTTGALGTGAIVNNANLTFNRSDAISVSTAISGTGSLIQAGTGTITLTGANTYSGATTVSAGTLKLIDTTSFASDITVNSGATLSLARTPNGFANRSALTKLIYGSGTVSIDSPTPGIAGGWVAFSSANNGLASTFTGNVVVNSGVLTMDSLFGAWSSNASLTVNSGGLFALRGQSLNVASLSGSGSIFTGYGTSTLAVNNTGNSTFSGTINGNFTDATDGALQTGTVNLVKNGTGTLTLTGANTYSGTTTVNAGTLVIGGAGTLGSGTYAGAISVATGSNLTYSSSAAQTLSGVISGAGNLVKDTSATSTLTLTGNNTYSGSTAISAGTLQVGNGGTTGTLGTGNIVNNGTLVYSYGTAKSLTLPTTANYSGSGALTATAGNIYFGGNLSLGTGALTLNSTSASALGGPAVVDSAVTAGSVAITGTYYTQGQNSKTLSFDTSATNGAINITDLALGVSGIQYSYNNLAFNTGTGKITLSGTNTLNWWNTGSTLSLTGDIAGSGSITQGGAATGNLTATMSTPTGINSTYSGVISGAIQVVKNGAGTLALAGNNTYSGTTTISAGILQVGNGGTTGTLGTGNIVNNANLVYSYSTTRAMILPNTTNYSGSGNLTATAGNIYFSGNLALGAGALSLAATSSSDLGGPNSVDSAITAGSVSISGMYLGPAGTTKALTFDTSATNGAINITDFMLGKASVQVSYNNVAFNAGTGTITLAGTNTLNWWNGGATTTLSGNIAGSGSIGQAGGPGNNMTLILSTPTGVNSTFSGAISGANIQVVKNGAGTLSLTGTNTYTAGTTINAGILNLGSAGALGTTGTISFGGGTLQHSAANTSDYSARFSTAAGQNRLIDTNGQAVTYAGVLAGTGSTLSKLGAGTLILTGGNTYTGTTTISTGTLQVGNGGIAGTLGTGSIINNADLVYSYSTARAMLLPNTTNYSGSGNLTATAGNIYFSGNLALGAGALSLAATSTSDLGGPNSVDSAITAGSVNISGMYLGPAGTAKALTFDTSATNGAINITNFMLGKASVQVSYGTLGFNAGTGTVTLAGTNTLNWWNGGATTTLTGNIAGSGSIGLDGSPGSNMTINMVTPTGINSTYSGVISGAAIQLTKSGAGTLNLTGNNTYGGSTAINAGTVNLSGSATSTSGLTIDSGATLNYTGTSGQNKIKFIGTTWTIAGTLNNQMTTGVVAQSLPSVVNLNGGMITGMGLTTDQFGDFFNSQNTTINITGNSAISGIFRGANTLTLNTVNATDSLQVNALIGNQSSGAIQTLIKSGLGSVTFVGSNTYTGTTTISGGTLQVGNGGTTGTLGTGAIVNNATLTFNRSDAMSVSSAISGTGNLIQAGTGTTTLSGANTYSGATSVNAGTLKAGSTSAFGMNSAVTVGATGTLDINGNNLSIGSLAGAAGSIVTNNGATAATLTTGALNTSTTFSGTMQDGTSALAITKVGNGSFSIDSAQTFTGALTIAQGGTGTNVDLLAGASLATGAVNIGTGTGGAVNNYATLRTRADNQLTNAVVTFNGTGSKYGYFILEGTSQSVKGLVDSTLSGIVESTENLSSVSSTLTLTGTGTYSFNGFVRNSNSGTGNVLALVKNGTGTQTLIGMTGANPGTNITYTGDTTINAGTFKLVDTIAAAFNSASTVNSGATLSLARTVNGFANRGTLTRLISGSGTVSIDSPTSGIAGGWVRFLGTNSGLSSTFTGNVVVNSGVLATEGGSAAWNSAASLTVNSGGLFAVRGQNITVANLSGSGIIFSSWALNSLTINNSNANTFSGAIIGNGTGASDGDLQRGIVSIVKTGAGSLTLSGANTYTGSTTANGGTLIAGSASAFGVNSAVTVGAAGILDLNGNTMSLGSLAGSAGGIVTNNGAAVTLTTGALNTSTTFSGTITDGTGTIALTKSGTGTMTLAGANTYSGTTTVNAGTLTLSGSWNRGTGTATTVVASGATLNGTGVVTAATLAHSGAGTLALSGNNLIDSLSTTGTTGSVSLKNVKSLSVGSISATSIALQTTGASSDLTIGSGAVLSASGTGTAVVLAAGRNFINLSGAGAITLSGTGGPNWQVYAASSVGNTYNNLDSGNAPVWGKTYGQAISETGNRYIFANAPTLTFTSVNDTKIYGNNATTALQNKYAVSGLEAVAGAYQATSTATAFTGAPVLSSTGAAVTANVGTYAIDVAAGSLTALNGFTFAYANTGVLTVDARPITVTADAKTINYGNAIPAFTWSVTNGSFVNNDTLSGAMTTPATLGSGVGTYAIN